LKDRTHFGLLLKTIVERGRERIASLGPPLAGGKGRWVDLPQEEVNAHQVNSGVGRRQRTREANEKIERFVPIALWNVIG